MTLFPDPKHSKCHGFNCERRESCCRYLRPVAPIGQAWAGWDSMYPRGDRCTGYEEMPEPRGKQ